MRRILLLHLLLQLTLAVRQVAHDDVPDTELEMETVEEVEAAEQAPQQSIEKLGMALQNQPLGSRGKMSKAQ